MLALLINEALLNEHIKGIFLMFILNWNNFGSRLLLKNRNVIFKINIFIFHHRLCSIDAFKFWMHVIRIFYLLSVYITKMNVENAVTLVIQVCMRYVIARIGTIQCASTNISIFVKL